MDEPFNDLSMLSADEVATAAGNATAVACFRLTMFLGQRLRYLMDRRLKEDGLTSRQGFMLTVVRDRGAPTLGEVAQVMSTTHQNARQVATALERKGFLAIETDARDGRVRRLRATDRGAEGFGGRDAGDYAAIADWFAALRPAELEDFSRLLTKLAASVPDRP